MFEAGLSLEEIGDYVGHNSAYMTDRYRHLREGHEASSGALLRLPGGSDWRNNWRIGPLSRLVEPSKAGLLSRWSEVRILAGALTKTSRNPLRQAGFGFLSSPLLPLETAKDHSALALTGAQLTHAQRQTAA